jgi:adenosylhomocysteine nucleosidase
MGRDGIGHDGVVSAGDHNIIINASTIHPNARVGPGAATPGQPAVLRRPGRWQVGIITVIPVETRAVLDMLGQAGSYRSEVLGGRHFHEGHLPVSGGLVGVVATQALGPGQRPTVVAYQQIRARYAVPIVVLVGIAGGIHPDLDLADVVIATRVVYTESRRDDPGRTRHRGEAHDVPPAIQHALNAFFTRYGEPAPLRRRVNRHTVAYRVRPGPLGSGEAVIRDRDHPDRHWLHAFHDKVLAVDTEAAALAHAFHEDRDADPPPHGWLVIRGISDRADADKDDLYHAVAAGNAAHAFRTLLPYLVPGAVCGAVAGWETAP